LRPVFVPGKAQLVLRTPQMAALKTVVGQALHRLSRAWMLHTAPGKREYDIKRVCKQDVKGLTMTATLFPPMLHLHKPLPSGPSSALLHPAHLQSQLEVLLLLPAEAHAFGQRSPVQVWSGAVLASPGMPAGSIKERPRAV